MRFTKAILQVPACVIGLAFTGGVISLVTAIVCEEVGLVRYLSNGESLEAWFRTLLLGATAGGLLGFVWSAERCRGRLAPVLETDDDAW